MTASRRLGLAASAVVPALLLAGLSLAGPAQAHSQAPSPGSPGVGDRLYPDLGNGGYDVRHYDLRLRYATTAPAQPVAGSETITAVATQALSRFDLDFAGRSVSAISVDGRTAAFTRRGGELVITPARPIGKGRRFTVEIGAFGAVPTEPGDTDPTYAFFVTADGSATAGQPEVMHYLYPSNDHPSDKATFSFTLDVPAGEAAVANGDLVSKRARAGRTVWKYAEREPMATELTQVAVGAMSVIQRGRVGGVRVRDVVPTNLLSTYRGLLGVEKSQLTWMEKRVGRYPGDLYGTLVVSQPDLGFALETQTLSLFDTTWFTDYPRGVWEPTMLHELSHQWFGDDVSPAQWSDVWLNEGHATWYELNYAAEHGMLKEDEPHWQTASFTTLMKDLYAVGDQYRADDGPVALPVDADHVFASQVYEGAALALYALRQKVGAATFDRIERAWIGTHGGGSASTKDFIALAAKVAHRPALTGFLRAWLYGTTTPAMPGHPDWTVDPVQPSSSAAARVAVADRRR
jgi:aminopeptidase N